ncbi:hypothetical protein NECAME_08257 [Necator americanus]|uniref:Uncharacterized protein n=1 Tax=Necator americanus TaxID=51031 RepID=W2TJL2_NECAM|nr:hypothetical protein NECAME_08257 [Necator americanus]ETN81998.1 hypothetical protein NECAME_08257 [Necator americanus]
MLENENFFRKKKRNEEKEVEGNDEDNGDDVIDYGRRKQHYLSSAVALIKIRFNATDRDESPVFGEKIPTK